MVSTKNIAFDCNTFSSVLNCSTKRIISESNYLFINFIISKFIQVLFCEEVSINAFS